ncbi:MAG: NAD(+)/NADH kinase [Calditrichaeota bacterium]|nr:MAG: NAD(+)/NADH kinase [Calditrichota bacterium]
MNFGIITNTLKPQAINLLPDLKIWLRNQNQTVVSEEDFATGSKNSNQIRKEIVKQSDVLISLGGDGTILATAQIVGESQKPILGVNFGTLGFLTETNVSELYAHLKKIIIGNYKIEQRFPLEGSFKGKKSFALNDFVIEKGKFTRLIETKVEVNGDFVNTYLSDGVIIATPTGSTAYSLSCGGPIVTPETEVVILTPVSPHNLTTRPLVFPIQNEISIQVVSSESSPSLSADGMFVNSLNKGEIFTVRKSKFSVNLIRCSDKSFYDILRAKLHWGEDTRSSVGKKN